MQCPPAQVKAYRLLPTREITWDLELLGIEMAKLLADTVVGLTDFGGSTVATEARWAEAAPFRGPPQQTLIGKRSSFTANS